ncbi:OmpW family outer membrane protein [Phenylobacterium sp.]|uniref:OmpW/AlkL family protein n=1 Tax=Phenylobacterium sp. TaxID=1871053 RepID=UPI00199AED57|nr:OmpW family outer membrane protein [Phenylobacterium sp.]MBC7166204.1 outer membrane beta-barrel protein [Phenylobacterium sp.]
MKTYAAVLAAGLALGLAGAASAQDFQPKAAGVKMINVRVTDVDPEAGDPITTLAGAATGLTAEVDYDVMPTIGLTYFFTDNIAAEVIAGTTQHKVKAKGAGVDLEIHETWVLPPVVSLQYHFAPAAKVSPYVGAGVNYMIFYSGEDKNGFDVDIDDGFGLALQAGVDIATQGPWSVNLDVKKVFFKTDATDNTNGVKTKVSLDPWVISGGFGYKF